MRADAWPGLADLELIAQTSRSRGTTRREAATLGASKAGQELDSGKRF